MTLRTLLLLLATLSSLSFSAQAQTDKSPHSEATLVSETTSIQPGVPFTVALQLKMDEKWHSYWRNPGDSGLATKIEWNLPAGFKAGDIQWPYPEKIDTPPLVTYGYEDEVWLLTKITPPANLPVGKDVTLKAKAKWLICLEVCLPAEADLKLSLPVRAAKAEPNALAQMKFEETRTHIPLAAEALGYAVVVERAPASKKDEAGGFVLKFRPPAPVKLSADDLKGAYFFVGDEATLAHEAPQTVTSAGEALQIQLAPSEYSDGTPKRLRGVLLAPEGKSWDAAGTVRAISIDTPINAPGAAKLETPTNDTAAGTVAPDGAGQGKPTKLGLALLLAFGGGVLLNLMPCVFPVLSLKVLSFVQQAGEAKSKVRLHGLAFGAGVLLSFWALAGVLLAVRAAGGGVGWGFQLQSPLFVAGLALLIFGVGLNLLGAFEIGTGLTRLGGATSGQHGYTGSFLSGVLATVVATPCTAPFMSVALGYALAQSAFIAMAVFTSLGLGMALPYMLLSFNPAWMKKLPKPGAWMETLKQFMAFPMFATALWLGWVFGLQTGVDGLAGLVGAFLLMGFASWLASHWRESRSDTARVLARGLAGVALLLALLVAWRGAEAMPEASVAQASESAASTLAPKAEWQPFSAEKVAELRAAGKPVFIDFTAAWCITCQINKKTTLAQPEVLDAFKERGVTLMRADWTRRDPEITNVLQSYGRSGVPVYALYSSQNKNDQEELPRFLPELLTEPIVLNALQDIPVLSADAGETPVDET